MLWLYLANGLKLPLPADDYMLLWLHLALIDSYFYGINFLLLIISCCYGNSGLMVLSTVPAAQCINLSCGRYRQILDSFIIVTVLLFV